MITLHVISPLYTHIEGKRVPFHVLDHELSFPVQGHQFHRAFMMWKRSKGKFGWDGRKHLLHAGEMVFPTGLLPRVEKLFRKLKVEYRVKSHLKVPVNGIPYKLKGVTLRDYQENAVNDFIKAQRGVVQAPTGAGKTLLVLGAAACLNVPTLILAHTRALVGQWAAEVTKVCSKKKLAVLRGGKWTGDPMTADIMVASLGSLASKKMNKKRAEKQKKILARVKFLVGDEVHHSPSNTFTKIVSMIDAFYRLGVSATPFDRADGTGLLLEGYFGPIIHSVEKAKLVEQGHLAKGMVVFLECSKPDDLEERKRLTYTEAYKAGVVYNEHRNLLLVKAMAKQIRLHKKRVLCLVREIIHGYKLLETAEKYILEDRTAYVTAATPPNIIQDVLSEFNKGNIDLVIASPVFGEGVDIPSADVVVVADSGKSVIGTTQKIGRGSRTNQGKKTRYLVIDVLDLTHPYLANHAEARINVYEKQGLEFVERPSDAWVA